MRERRFCGQSQRVQHAAVIGQHQRLEGEREGAAAAQSKRCPVQRTAAAAAGRAVSRGQCGAEISLRILRANSRAGIASARAARSDGATGESRARCDATRRAAPQLPPPARRVGSRCLASHALRCVCFAAGGAPQLRGGRRAPQPPTPQAQPPPPGGAPWAGRPAPRRRPARPPRAPPAAPPSRPDARAPTRRPVVRKRGRVSAARRSRSALRRARLRQRAQLQRDGPEVFAPAAVGTQVLRAHMQRISHERATWAKAAAAPRRSARLLDAVVHERALGLAHGARRSHGTQRRGAAAALRRPNATRVHTHAARGGGARSGSDVLYRQKGR